MTELSAREPLAAGPVAVERLTTEPTLQEAPSLLRDLVPLARAGDDAAREELANRSGRAAYGLALQLLRNQAEAQDVAQDALLKFFSTLDRFDESRPVLPWIFRIVRNRAIDVLRAEGHNPATMSRKRWLKRAILLFGLIAFVFLVFGPTHIVPVDPATGPHEHSVRLDLQKRIWQCLQAVTPQHREILILRDYQDLSYREISEVLGTPLGTVMSRLHAARKKLREQLLDGGWVFGGDHD